MALARWWNPLSRWRAPARVSAGAPVVQEAVRGDARLAPAPDHGVAPDARIVVGACAAEPTEAGEAYAHRLTDAAHAGTELRGPFIAWLLSSGETASGSADAPADPLADPAVQRMFARLDEVIASAALRAHLLPRAPHVVPQLMKTLRDERYSSADVAQRISKDVVLTAEVIRVAANAERRGGDAADSEIDLARAVAVIGTQGLRRAIANVVLRPIFDARGDTLSARAAARIWQDADRKARLCAALAAQQALDPFDGYLAGLLHDTGWSALLRAIDGFPDAPPRIAQLTNAQAAAGLFRRRDALFGALVEPWQLGPTLTQLAVEVGRDGLAAAQSTLAAALATAERLATLYALAPGSRSGAQCVPGWAALAEPVRQCWTALSATGPGSS